MSSDDPVVRVPRQTLQHVSALLDAMDAVTSNMRVLSERVNRLEEETDQIRDFADGMERFKRLRKAERTEPR